jgi:hypothetical protein
MPPIAVRVDPPLVVVRVHIGDVESGGALASSASSSSSTPRARALELRHRRRRVVLSSALELENLDFNELRRRSTRSTSRSRSRFPSSPRSPRRKRLTLYAASSRPEGRPMGIFSRLAQLIKSEPQRPDQPLGRPREDAEPGRPRHEQPAHRGEEAGRDVDRRREAARQAARARDGQRGRVGAPRDDGAPRRQRGAREGGARPEAEHDQLADLPRTSGPSRRRPSTS